MLFSSTVVADSIYQNRMSNNLSLKMRASTKTMKLNLDNLVKYKYMLMNQNNVNLLRNALKEYKVQKSTIKGTKNLKKFMKFHKMRNQIRY